MDDLLALTKKLCLEVDENRRKIADLEKFRDRHNYPEDGKTTFLMRCEGLEDLITYECFTAEEAAEVLGRKALGEGRTTKKVGFTLESREQGITAYFAKREYTCPDREEIITMKLYKSSIHNDRAKEKIKKEYQRLWPVSEKLVKTVSDISYTLKAYSFPCSVVTKVFLQSFEEAGIVFASRLGALRKPDCKWFWFLVGNEFGQIQYFKTCEKKSGVLETVLVSADEAEKIKATK